MKRPLLLLALLIMFGLGVAGTTACLGQVDRFLDRLIEGDLEDLESGLETERPHSADPIGDFGRRIIGLEPRTVPPVVDRPALEKAPPIVNRPAPEKAPPVVGRPAPEKEPRYGAPVVYFVVVASAFVLREIGIVALRRVVEWRATRHLLTNVTAESG